MTSLLALTKLYLIGSLRRRIFLVVLLVAAIMAGLPPYVEAFSLGHEGFERVAKEFAITILSLFSVAMAVLVGSTSLASEVQSRSLYAILARPLSRQSYLSAHLLALALLLGGSLVFLGLVFTVSLAWRTGVWDSSLPLALWGAFLQALVVGTVCIAFSVRSSPALAGTIGGAVFLIGNLSGAFIRFFLIEDRDSSVSSYLAKGLKGIIPNLTLFGLKDPVVHQMEIPAGYTLAITYHAGIWILLLLTAAGMLFERSDL